MKLIRFLMNEHKGMAEGILGAITGFTGLTLFILGIASEIGIISGLVVLAGIVGIFLDIAMIIIDDWLETIIDTIKEYKEYENE